MDKLGNRVYATLPPEDDEGCIEYKWSLAKVNSTKHNKLTSQMKWRVCQASNSYSALYILGIHDNGQLTGISRKDLIATYLNLLDCAREGNLYGCVRKFQRFRDSEKYWAILQIFHNTERDVYRQQKKSAHSDLDLPHIPNHKLPTFFVL